MDGLIEDDDEPALVGAVYSKPERSHQPFHGPLSVEYGVRDCEECNGDVHAGLTEAEERRQDGEHDHVVKDDVDQEGPPVVPLVDRLPFGLNDPVSDNVRQQ